MPAELYQPLFPDQQTHSYPHTLEINPMDWQTRTLKEIYAAVSPVIPGITAEFGEESTPDPRGRRRTAVFTFLSPVAEVTFRRSVNKVMCTLRRSMEDSALKGGNNYVRGEEIREGQLQQLLTEELPVLAEEYYREASVIPTP